mmetsp:Transcript_39894/g.56218  ORF Transcript_39894/g.56218 Transcript_39894/m.56218 type:complete len:120 (-) Transcript_39894:120-479(-)
MIRQHHDHTANDSNNNDDNRQAAMLYLKNTLAIIQTKSQRLQDRVTFGVPHLKLAIEVWQKLESENKTLRQLADEEDTLGEISFRTVEKYMRGDPNSIILRKSLEKIADGLRAWMKEKT